MYQRSKQLSHHTPRLHGRIVQDGLEWIWPQAPQTAQSQVAHVTRL